MTLLFVLVFPVRSPGLLAGFVVSLILSIFVFKSAPTELSLFLQHLFGFLDVIKSDFLISPDMIVGHFMSLIVLKLLLNI
jgi:hypothetical protein